MSIEKRKARIIQLYNEGWSSLKIARQLKCPVSTVTWALRKWGIRMRPLSESRMSVLVRGGWKYAHAIDNSRSYLVYIPKSVFRSLPCATYSTTVGEGEVRMVFSPEGDRRVRAYNGYRYAVISARDARSLGIEKGTRKILFKLERPEGNVLLLKIKVD
jgi:hypothetical protein